MPIAFDCPSCGATLRANEGDRGKTFKCPRCGKPAVAPGVGVAGNTPAIPSGHREYMVIGFQGKGLKGHFDKEQIANTLNQHAAAGWSLKTASVAASGGYLELLTILERGGAAAERDDVA